MRAAAHDHARRAAADSGQESNLHAAQLVAEAIGWGAFGGLAAGIAGAGRLRFASGRGLIAEAWIPIVPFVTRSGRSRSRARSTEAAHRCVRCRRRLRPDRAARSRSDVAERTDRQRAERGNLHRVRRRHLRGPLEQDRCCRGRLRRLELEDPSHAAGRDRDARNTRPNADNRSRRSVRIAWSRVDRVRPRRRCRRTAPHLDTDHGDHVTVALSVLAHGLCKKPLASRYAA